MVKEMNHHIRAVIYSIFCFTMLGIVCFLSGETVHANIATSGNFPGNPNNINITKNFTVIPGYNSSIDSAYTNQVIITPNAKNQKGGIWYNYKLNLKQDFYVSIATYLGTKNMYELGADGITFTMHNDPRGMNAIGSMGGGLGAYQGAKGDTAAANKLYIQNGLSVEIDTFANYHSDATVEMYYDRGVVSRWSGTTPNNISKQAQVVSHTAFVKPGTYDSVMNWNKADSGYPGHAGVMLWNEVKKTETGLWALRVDDQFTNNKWRYLNVKWDATAKMLQYSVTNDKNQQMHPTNTKSLAVDPITEFGSNWVHWGFTGGTGLYSNEQRVAIMNFPQEPNAIVEKSVKNVTASDTAYQTISNSNLTDQMEYKLKVTNNAGSPMPIVNGKIWDLVNLGQTYLSGSLKINGVAKADPTFTSRTFKVDLADEILANETVEVTYRVSVDQAITNPILNQFTLSSQYASSLVSNETKVYINPKVTLKKQVDKKHSYVNDELLYTLTATNEVKAGKWVAGSITDRLPEHTTYVKGSTTIKNEGASGYSPIDDGLSWNNSFDQLVISGVSLEAGQSASIQFKVKVLDTAINRVIENIAEYQGSNINNEKLDVGKSNQVETYIDFMLLNLRQVVLNPHEEQVQPVNGYFGLLNKSSITGNYELKTNIVTKSTTFDKYDEIEPTLFTKVLIPKLIKSSLGYQIKNRIPEYYEYVGHIQSVDGSKIKEEHLSANLSSNSNLVSPFIDYNTHHEYWVTVFIQPHFGTDNVGNMEKSPRLYSWNTIRNDFGTILKNVN